MLYSDICNRYYDEGYEFDFRLFRHKTRWIKDPENSNSNNCGYVETKRSLKVELLLLIRRLSRINSMTDEDVLYIDLSTEQDTKKWNNSFTANEKIKYQKYFRIINLFLVEARNRKAKAVNDFELLSSKVAYDSKYGDIEMQYDIHCDSNLIKRGEIKHPLYFRGFKGIPWGKWEEEELRFL